MTTFPLHSFDTLSARAAGSMLASVWQGALLAGCVAAVLLTLRGLSAAVRSVVWMSVLLLVTSLPLLTFRRVHAEAGAAGHATALHFDARWGFAIAGLWVAVSLFRFAQLAVSAWRLRSLRRSAISVSASAAVQALLQAGGRSAKLCVSSDVDRPSVAGFFRPCILLPADLLAHATESELAQIVLHEMEHLRRRDDWTNLLQKLALALFPLNPVLFWLDRRLCLERELACDDGVLRATNARTEYAACLTNLAEHSLLRRGLSLALGAVGASGSWKPQSEVGRRVMRILRRPEATMGRMQTRFAAGALLAGVLAGAVLLGRSPALVSFVPQAAPVQTQAALPVPSAIGLSHFQAAHIVPAAFEVGHARAIAVRAVLPVSGAKKAVAVLRKRPSSAARFVRTSVSDTRRSAPREVLASWRPSAAPARLGLMLLEDSQFRYAAVPVRDGWLVIQL